MKKQTPIIDMEKYVESEPIHEKCEGCDKAFDFEYAPPEGEILIQEKKCLVYPKPSSWWRERKIATKEFLVRSKENPKGVWQTLPVTEFRCPVATHVSKTEEAIKAKLNPLKASKRRKR